MLNFGYNTMSRCKKFTTTECNNRVLLNSVLSCELLYYFQQNFFCCWSSKGKKNSDIILEYVYSTEVVKMVHHPTYRL